MNHMPRRQPITAGEFGVAGFATAERRHSTRSSGPAARWMHHRHRRRPSSDVFAAFTIASTPSVVMSATMTPTRRSDQARTRAQAEASALTVTPCRQAAAELTAWNISRMISQPPTNSP